MITKPMKILELHYPLKQVLIKLDVSGELSSAGLACKGIHLVGTNQWGHIFFSPLGSFVQYIAGSSPVQEDTAEGTEAFLG